MSLQLHAHPFSSYCQKALIALYENDTPFEFRLVNLGDAQSAADFAKIWPLKRMPALVDHDRVYREATIVIEYLDRAYPGRTRFIPDDFGAALETRFMDRFFDNYVMAPMMAVVFDFIREASQRDPFCVMQAKALLDTSYAWLDETLSQRAWAAGGAFTLADCAAAPSLFYADWVHPIPAERRNLRDFRTRLLARPSFARCVEEARPYRGFFPPGAPDRD